MVVCFHSFGQKIFKMTALTLKQLKDYKENGYVAPIDVLSLDESKEIKREIEYIEKKWPDELVGLGRNNVHYISPIFDKVCHNSKILDAVESLVFFYLINLIKERMIKYKL